MKAWRSQRNLEREQPSITCPECHMKSYNPNDIDQRYCGNCHKFHSEMEK